MQRLIKPWRSVLAKHLLSLLETRAVVVGVNSCETKIINCCMLMGNHCWFTFGIIDSLAKYIVHSNYYMSFAQCIVLALTVD